MWSILSVLLLSGLCVLALTVQHWTPKLGLDLRGGLSVVLTAKTKTTPEVLEKTVDVIRNRVDSLGTQEPEVSTAGSENILVSLPGVSDPKRALEIVGKTAQLRFRSVLGQEVIGPDHDSAVREAKEKGLKDGTEEYGSFINAKITEKHPDWKLTQGDPADAEVIFAGSESEGGERWFKLGRAEVTGDQIKDAYPRFDETSGTWGVELELKSEGARRFADVTTRLAPNNGQLAIVLDQTVESAPQVQSAITDGRAQISGTFTEREAKDLALVLNAGALPIELEQSQVQRVSPTLGEQSLQAGLLAGAIGLALVVLYMLLFYRLLGLITVVGLTLFSALVMGIIGLIGRFGGFTLTLAGIAGLIVSVGIAADSYIVYYERVKDELREGKTFRSAVDRGFASAFRTSVNANLVAFTAAIILYVLAVGPVRGFALTLGLSALVDIMLLYFWTHPAVALIARNRKLAGLRAVGMGEVKA